MNIHTTSTSTLERVPAELRKWLSVPRPMLINGKWVQAKSGKVFDVIDPATEMHLATVAEGDADTRSREHLAARDHDRLAQRLLDVNPAAGAPGL